MGQHAEETTDPAQTDYLEALDPDAEFLGGGGTPNNSKIVIPYNLVQSLEDASFKQGITGLQIEAALQLEGPENKRFLCLRMENQTGQELADLMVKFQANSYCLNPIKKDLALMSFPSGQSDVEVRLELDLKGPPNSQPPDCPIKIKVALNTNIDIFVFEIPCSFTIFLEKYERELTEEQYNNFINNERAIKTKNSIECEDTNVIIESVDVLIKKLQDNNIDLLFKQERGNGNMLNCIAGTVDGMPVGIQIYLARDSNQILINYVVMQQPLVPLVFQALKFIINL